MARVKRGLMRHKRHKKIVDRAKGYWGRKKNVFRRANEQLLKSGQYAFRDRRARKRDFRRLWVVRLTGACEQCDMKYSQLIHGLNLLGSQLNRKMLSEMAIEDFESFKTIASAAKAASLAAAATPKS